MYFAHVHHLLALKKSQLHQLSCLDSQNGLIATNAWLPRAGLLVWNLKARIAHALMFPLSVGLECAHTQCKYPVKFTLQVVGMTFFFISYSLYFYIFSEHSWHWGLF